jgi:SNF2 family DNA or RNA helicase
MTRPSLKEYQREGVDWIRWVARGLLADEPGLGKTRQAIEAFDGGHNLVVAPNLVIEGGTWADEIEKWSHYPDRWTVVPYSQLNVRERQPWPMKVKGRPHPKAGQMSGPRPMKKLPDLVKGHWDAFVLDEAHYVKGRGSFWTWAVMQINKQADATLPMTGTPFPNWAHEIFTILQLLNPKEARAGGEYGSFWRWAGEWFDITPTRFSNGMPVAGELLMCSRSPRQLKECLSRPPSDPCEHYLEFAEKNLGERYLRRWREDVLDLPPFTDQTVHTPMDAATKKAYLALKQDFYATYLGNEILAWNQGELNVRLAKLTTSPWLLTKAGKPGGGKLDMLRFDLQSRTRPTLVFAHYKDSVEACAAVATSIGASARIVHGDIPTRQRAESIAAFKSGKLDVLCGSLETMAEGHTLVASDFAIFVEESFKPSRNEQAKFRIYRLGQERPVTIKRYITPNSVDSKKQRLLAMKTDRQMRHLTAAEFMEII